MVRLSGKTLAAQRASRSHARRALCLLTEALVDAADLFNPAAAVAVLELQDLFERPVEVVGDEGYLLVELRQGVARYSPAGPNWTSTSKRFEQAGHVACTRLCPLSLMRR